MWHRPTARWYYFSITGTWPECFSHFNHLYLEYRIRYQHPIYPSICLPDTTLEVIRVVCHGWSMKSTSVDCLLTRKCNLSTRLVCNFIINSSILALTTEPFSCGDVFVPAKVRDELSSDSRRKGLLRLVWIDWRIGSSRWVGVMNWVSRL